MTEHPIKLHAAVSRRSMLKLCGASLAGLATTQVFAGGHAKVDPAGAQAAALGYVEDATTVDTAKYPQFEAGKMCSNCILYTGAEDAAYGPCAIFPGKEVNKNGWCSTHQPKP